MNNNEELINAYKAATIIKSNPNIQFRVIYIKKNGITRILIGRYGVKINTKGQSMRYDPNEKNMINVFDDEIQRYRIINIDTIKSLEINNIKYKII